MHEWIADADDLAARIVRWRGVTAIGLDTEFIRERTWWAQLALVQIAVPGEAAACLVDMTAPGMAAALAPLLADRAVCKIMHSASEDIQALQHACAAVPAPLFDTQIAAALAGVGAGLGYQKLVETLLGISLPKSQTRSDWMRRPLSPSQLEYAADDVLHLAALQQRLEEKLHSLGRDAWLAEDCERLLASAGDTAPDPWPHLAMRGAQVLDAPAQARLCRLLRWREAQALASDLPKSWVVANDLVLHLARRPPADRRAFDALLDATPKAPRRTRNALWECLIEPLTAAEREIPLAKPPTEAEQRLLRRLQDAVATVAAGLALDPGVLAPRRTLEGLLVQDRRHTPLAGWRRAQLEPILAPLLAEAGIGTNTA